MTRWSEWGDPFVAKLNTQNSQSSPTFPPAGVLPTVDSASRGLFEAPIRQSDPRGAWRGSDRAEFGLCFVRIGMTKKSRHGPMPGGIMKDAFVHEIRLRILAQQFHVVCRNPKHFIKVVITLDFIAGENLILNRFFIFFV